jgi:hypothetical protein
VTPRRFVLHGLEWFRGMRVSGFVNLKSETGRLVISGPAAARGTIVIGRHSTGGRIGGHRVTENDLGSN